MWTDILREYVAGGFSGIWLVTEEPIEAEAAIQKLGKANDWNVLTWDIAQGIKGAGIPSGTAVGDPAGAIKVLASQNQGPTVLVANSYHRFLPSAEIVALLGRELAEGKACQRFLVILAPSVAIPPELTRQMIVLEHDLPTQAELKSIALGLIEDGEIDEASLDSVVEAASGLGVGEAESAFALSLVRHGKLCPDAVFSVKASSLKKSGPLTLLEVGEEDRFENLGGFDGLRDYSLRALAGSRVKARGVLISGVPGCGKSSFARCLGNATGRPVLNLDVGGLYQSLVGETERALREALKRIDAVGKSILLIDEAERALAGHASQGDSGVSTRVMGSLLTWLSDRKNDAFVILTANEVKGLPAPLTRAERLDSIWFVDYPDAATREGIWRIYIQHYGLDGGQPRPRHDKPITGAEIKSTCRIAALLGLSLVDASRFVVPVSSTSAEVIDALRTWAKGRALCVSKGGLFGVEPLVTTPARKSRSVKPSLN
jgi:hypothetical protein